ncbi:MAG: class glutamine amidotransferase [Frankiales bacterium]|nr:class glutamine amidotransferase [Frankiales bacterium]
MCRLVGWVSETPRTLAEVLGGSGLAELIALSHQHEDGWGTAWWDADRLQTVSSHLPAHASPDFGAWARDVRADAALVHLRWATPGIAVRPENTHPFVIGDYAFGHNGAVRPKDGLLPMLSADTRAGLGGDTDSERLLHVLVDRVIEHGLDDGLRRTVTDVCRDLTPSSLNVLLLGREELTALCCHGAASEGDAPVLEGPPEDQPGYFDMRWRRDGDAVVVASQPLGDRGWQRMDNGTALVVRRGSVEHRTVQIGMFSDEALRREQARRQVAAVSGAP